MTIDLLDRIESLTTENLGDVFIEETETFADVADRIVTNGASSSAIQSLLRYGIAYRQDELSQRLVGQDDHPAFGILDAALDALEGAL